MNQMLRTLTIAVLLVTAPLAFATKYAGEPFSLGVGAGPLGMGGAVIAGPFNATAAYWNPAGLAYLSGRQIQTMHAETFGSLLNHDYIGFASGNGKPSGLTSYGLYLYYLGGGGIKITGFDPETEWPYVIREENHFDLMLGASLAGKYRDNIAYGVTAKVLYRDIAEATGYGLGLDAGLVYQVDSFITAGLMITDLTSTFLAYSNDQTESIYPAVRPALSYRWYNRDVTIRVSGQSIVRFEGRRQAAELWQGRVSADFQAGLEIGYRGTAFGRAGYDQGKFTAGLGAAFDRYMIDLAYLHHEDLDETFRVSAGIQF
jgi:hypothetical protein